ncbi:MAG: dihydroorotate dehydrogenase [Lachnospiraceae bacterium]|nr:dihydroorotate dehydrogenase [Lachnospiraceae bacterium]
MDTKINIAGIEFKNPIMTASGTFGSGMEYADFVDLNELGAVITKGVSAIPWEGNPTPRVAETPSGMLNAIGLQNPGVEVFINRDLEFLKQFDVRIIVNVCGKTIEDYLKVVRALAGTGADMLEINISCPNVKAGALSFGQEPKVVEEITKKIKKEAKQPVIMKLTPNVTDIREIAKAAEAGGADAISLINTITGMKIDIWKRKFALANKTGGLSGPAIHPVAVRMVYDCARTVKIPIIGMGGVESGEDAIELMLAGATAVAVGTSNFYRPDNAIRVLDEMAEVMEKQEVSDIKEFINGVS